MKSARIPRALFSVGLTACLVMLAPSRESLAAVGYQYDGLGRLTRVQYENGTTIRYDYDSNGNLLATVIASGTSGAGADPVGSPAAPVLTLGQSYPNPASGTAMIPYAVPRAGVVRLALFDVRGRRVLTLVEESMSAGKHQATFDTNRLSPGVYFYALEGAGRKLTRRLTILR